MSEAEMPKWLAELLSVATTVYPRTPLAVACHQSLDCTVDAEAIALIGLLIERIEKLQSEIGSHNVEAERRDKLGTAYEIFCAGWWGGRRATPRQYEDARPWETEKLASDWEAHQLDKVRI